MDYLAELVREKNNLTAFPTYFHHTERLLDIEISRVRGQLFQCNFQDELQKLPEPDVQEDKVILTEKVYVPVKEHPDFNFVGRILGPRGMTAKQLEHETGCKIMVRGRGSMRDDSKEEHYRGKPNWDHLEDDLHILIQCEDAKEQARKKLDIAATQVKKLLLPTPGGIDELKRKQLMELSIINGTYRTNSKRLMPSLSLGQPVRQPLVSPPLFHSAVAQKTFFGHSPLPSPLPLSYKPNVQTGKGTFDFTDFYKHLAIEPYELPININTSEGYAIPQQFHRPAGLSGHMSLRKTKSGPHYVNANCSPSEGRPIEGMPTTPVAPSIEI